MNLKVDSRIVLLGIAFVAIGMFILPETVAMFVGQHDFYDTTTAGNGVNCLKCHADVRDELNRPSNVNLLHRFGFNDARMCEDCHMTTAPQGKEGLKQGPGGQFHAAAAPACLDCHGGTGPGLSALEIITGSEEVHKAFANESNKSKLLKGANEACISCHTHIGVNITWTKATTMEFDSKEIVLPDGSHYWNITQFNATGVNVTKTSG
jgi:hypothetical protein